MSGLLVAALAGGAAFVVAQSVLGVDAVKAAGVALLAFIVVDAVRDAWRSSRDRRDAYDRWREWTGRG